MANVFLPISVELNSNEFQQVLHNALAKRLSALIFSKISAIRLQVQLLVETAITQTKEWASLLSPQGELRQEFGIEHPEPTLKGIINAIKESVQVIPIPRNATGLGGVTVRVLRSGYDDILAVPGASYISVSKKGSSLIPWLDWLLTKGSGVIIFDSEFYLSGRLNKSGEFTLLRRKGSRTGSALMIHPRRRPSRGWGVPDEYAGTPQDNFLTRAISSIVPEVQAIIQKEILNG